MKSALWNIFNFGFCFATLFSYLLYCIIAAHVVFRERLMKTIKALKKINETIYKIYTYTGHKWFSGTNANVYIKLYGEEGDSATQRLDNKKENSENFSRGNVAEFPIKLKYIGYIYQIELSRDPGYGLWKNLLIDKVKVICLKLNKEFVFEIGVRLSGENLSTKSTHKGIPITSYNCHWEENRVSHHTEKYRIDRKEGIVLRRGQEFNLSVKLARIYNPNTDQFTVVLKGINEKEKTILQDVSSKDFAKQQLWQFSKVMSSDEKEIILLIYIPSTAACGKYKISLETPYSTNLELGFLLYVLFNPWCREDEVYMSDEEQLREYISRQHGVIFSGNEYYVSKKNWYFGQFENISLQASMYILEETDKESRASPVSISRWVSAKVNSNDNGGVLVGNWSGEYGDGKSPSYWFSSPDILGEYMEKKSPVKYGQCWVFSALVTTILRCLGIPCRSITNFNSAHDSNGDCTKDVYFDENGERISNLNRDSIWNFHVWNDAWMARNDLPDGYGGWQAVDATPQEPSPNEHGKRIYQMGPCPLIAIKEGEIDILYDSAFAFAEVNADIIHWKSKDGGDWKMTYRDRDQVGKKISTKALGSKNREDITSLYKYPEKSMLEKAAVQNAMLKKNHRLVKDDSEDRAADIQLAVVAESFVAGSDITYDVELTNMKNEEINVDLTVVARLVRYDGVVIATIDEQKKKENLKAQGKNTIGLRLDSGSYIQYLKDDISLKLFVTAFDHANDQMAVCDRVIDIEQPSLEIKEFPHYAKLGNEISFKVSFKNDLDITLYNCIFTIDGTILKDRLKITDFGDVKAKSELTKQISFIPDIELTTPSRKSVCIGFSSDQLFSAPSCMKVIVKP